MSGSGRATGRARGRVVPSDSPTQMPSEGSSSPGTPPGAAGDANRGRGGYRPETQLITRPAGTTQTSGEDGQPVSLFANFFKVETDDTAVIHDYEVQFEPQVESVKVRRMLVAKAGHLFPGRNGQPAFVFDGMFNLKALTALPDRTTELPVDEYRLTLRRAANPISWGSFEMMRFFNMQCRRNMGHLNWMQIYRNFYDPATKISMDRINVMLGLATAVNLHDAGILMCCDSINKIFRKDTVHEEMKEIHRRGGAAFQDNCRRELVGCIVMTTYNNRTYKIDDIDFDKKPVSTFDRRGRGQVSFVDYYKEQYQLNIRDPNQPLIVCLPSVRDKRAAEQRGQTATTHLLVPELCIMTGLSESLRNDFNLKKQLTQSTQLPPADRYNQLKLFRQKLEQNADVRADLSAWNLTYSRELVSVPGRVLRNERLVMSQPAGIEIQNPGDFQKQMQNQRMRLVQGWNQWIIIYTQRDGAVMDNFLTALRRVSLPLGLQLQPPQRAMLGDDRTLSYLNKLREWAPAEKPDGLAVCVFPNNNQERYSAVKKRLCVEAPCPSQCVLSKTLGNEKALMSVATKLCLQMACKAGSQPWGMDIPAKELMVIGYDTYHDGARRGESVGAFVASLNAGLSQYYSRVSYHKERDEMSNNVESNFRLALQEYEKRNKTLPKKVVMWRDGVGEGMIRHVFEREVAQLRSVVEDMSGNTMQLAVVIVTKRMNVKFFLKNEQTRRLENPIPGIVVDTAVTRPERLEFYLVSQSVRAGTVAPTSYNIIHNDVGWLPRHFQMLAYKMCHMYFNWPGTIRVPAPCQYAHKLAFLTGSALHREPHAALSDRLFFL